MEATAASPFAADRAVMYTFPPCRASPAAVALPIPVFAPVTRNVCSLTRNSPRTIVGRYPRSDAGNGPR